MRARYKIGARMYWGAYPVTIVDVKTFRGSPARYLAQFDNGMAGFVDEDQLDKTQSRIVGMAARVYAGESGYLARLPRKNSRRYGRRAGQYVREEMHRLGKSAHVRSRSEAVAVGLSRARRAGVRVPRANPSVLVFGNPPRTRPWDRATILSKRAVAIEYDHVSDGALYRHSFARGVVVEALADGSVRLYRPDGKPLWKMFNR